MLHEKFESLRKRHAEDKRKLEDRRQQLEDEMSTFYAKVNLRNTKLNNNPQLETTNRSANDQLEAETAHQIKKQNNSHQHSPLLLNISSIFVIILSVPYKKQKPLFSLAYYTSLSGQYKNHKHTNKYACSSVWPRPFC